MDEIVKQYVEKVLHIQDRAQGLSDEELREIALELGLNEVDLQRIEQSVNDGVLRAEGFMKHKVWTEAIEEWEEVLALSPNRHRARALLAKSFLYRGRRGDEERAKALAENVLQKDPSNALAFEVLAVVNKSKAYLPYLLGGLFLLFLIVLGAAFLREKAVESPPQKKVAPSVFQYRNDTFPLVVDAPPGIEIDIYKSKLNTYPKSSSYNLYAILRNHSELELLSVKGIFTYHLTQGDVEVHETDIRRKYQGGLRPSDASAFNELRIFKGKELKSVSVKIILEESVKAPAQYPPAASLPFRWGDGQSSSAFKLSIFERNTSIAEPNFLGSRFHRATWEFKNTGQAFTHLKMKIDFLSEDNQVFASDTFYVAANGAPVNPEESRIASSLKDLKKGKYHHYQLSVIEMH